MMKYIAGALGIFLLIFVVIWVMLRGDNGSSARPQTAQAQLITYAGLNSSVSVTTIGRLVGQDSHREVRISVSRNERRLEVLSGYDQNVTSSSSYVNTQSAYETFLSALGNAGFISSKKSLLDQRGICPTGNRYIYDLSVNGQHESNLWANNCNKLGTFRGQGSIIRSLFQDQIPDYSKQTQSVKL